LQEKLLNINFFGLANGMKDRSFKYITIWLFQVFQRYYENPIWEVILIELFLETLDYHLAYFSVSHLFIVFDYHQTPSLLVDNQGYDFVKQYLSRVNQGDTQALNLSSLLNYIHFPFFEPITFIVLFGKQFRLFPTKHFSKFIFRWLIDIKPLRNSLEGLFFCMLKSNFYIDSIIHIIIKRNTKAVHVDSNNPLLIAIKIHLFINVEIKPNYCFYIGLLKDLC